MINISERKKNLVGEYISSIIYSGYQDCANYIAVYLFV